MWTEHIDVSKEQIEKWLTHKNDLEIFKPWQPPSGNKPDYVNGGISREIRKMMRRTRPSRKRNKATIQ
jgi:hypothetical protein